MANPGRRQQRLGELIRTTLSEILQGMNDPRLEMVSLTRAEISKDMKHARIFFSVLGDEARMRTAQRGLEAARGRLQAELHNQVQLRFTPILRFEYDPAIAGSIRIAQLLKEALPEEEDPDEEREMGEYESADVKEETEVGEGDEEGSPQEDEQ